MPSDATAGKTDMWERWRQMLAHPCGRGDAGAVADALIAAYAGHGRQYHGVAHIEMLLRLVAKEAATFVDRPAVELAVLFHDAVYDVGRRDNEAASAALAVDALTRLGWSQQVCGKVAMFIEATSHFDATPPVDDPDLARFLDLDLSILAAEPETYDAYALAIRREYAAIADARYRRGRVAVLNALLARPRLYLCSDHHEAWDATARSNMRREITRLA